MTKHLVAGLPVSETNALSTRSALTLSNAEFDLEVNRCGDHRLCEDQDILQADHHHQVRKNLPAEREITGPVSLLSVCLHKEYRLSSLAMLACFGTSLSKWLLYIVRGK